MYPEKGLPERTLENKEKQEPEKEGAKKGGDIQSRPSWEPATPNNGT